MGRLSFTTADGEVHSLGKAYRGNWEDKQDTHKLYLQSAILLSQMSGKDVFYCLKRFGAKFIMNTDFSAYRSLMQILSI